MFHMKHLIQFLYIDIFHVKLELNKKQYKNVSRETKYKMINNRLLVDFIHCFECEEKYNF